MGESSGHGTGVTRGPAPTPSSEWPDPDKHLNDLNTLRISRCTMNVQVFISPRQSHIAQVEWMVLSDPGDVTHCRPVNKQGPTSQEKSVRMIIMNYDISSQSCQFLFSLFYRQHQFVFNVWLIEASVPKQSPSTRCSVTRRGCVGLIWNKVTFTTSFV